MNAAEPQRLEVAATQAGLREATDWLTGQLASVAASSQALYVATLVLEELFLNTLSYGYDNAPDGHRISVEFSLVGERFRLRYSDDGRPFDPFTQCPLPDLKSPLEARPVGGLGVHFICKMAEYRDYERRDGRNIITFERCYRCKDLMG